MSFNEIRKAVREAFDEANEQIEAMTARAQAAEVLLARYNNWTPTQTIEQRLDEVEGQLDTMNAQVESKTEQLTVVVAAMTEQAKEWERKLIAAQASETERIKMAQQELDELRAIGMMPVTAHNRIVAQTITAMDAERVSFEQEIERLRTELENYRSIAEREGATLAVSALAAMTERVKELEGANAGLRHTISVVTCNWDRLRDQQQATIAVQTQEIERLTVRSTQVEAETWDVAVALVSGVWQYQGAHGHSSDGAFIAAQNKICSLLRQQAQQARRG